MNKKGEFDLTTTSPQRARDLVRMSRSSELIGRAREALNPIVDWLEAANLRTFVHACQSRKSGAAPCPGAEIMQSLARDFHQRAGTLTPDIDLLLTSLSSRPAVRISHQPNFIAYLRLICLFPALILLADEVDAVPVYIVNDYDVVSNNRFRRAMFPSLQHETGYRYLRLPGISHSHLRPAFAVDPPEASWLHEIVATIHDVFRAERSIFAKYGVSVEPILEHVEADLRYAMSAALSLADLTSIFLSRLVTLRMRCPIVFVSGYEMWKRYGAEASLDVAEDWGRIPAILTSVYSDLFNSSVGTDSEVSTRTVDAIPYWWLCSCRCRVALTFLDTRSVELFGVCHACSVVIRFSISDRRALKDASAAGRLIPRVGMHDLGLGSLYGFAAGITYLSSADHAIPYGIVGQRLGLAMLPQIFLMPTGSFGTPIEDLGRLLGDQAPQHVIAAARVLGSGLASSAYVAASVSMTDFSEAVYRWYSVEDFESPIRLSFPR